MAKFTVIIPTYRRPYLLQKAILSALNQSYKDVAILVLDNASGDETAETVRRLQEQDSRIQYVCHEKNIGMIGQYEYGIDHVETEAFSFLSDDDLLLPSFCEISLKGLEQFADCCFFATSTMIYSKEKGILRIPLNLWPREGRYEPIDAAYTMVGQYPVPTTVAFRKSFLSQVKIDNENPLAWDCDLLLQLASRYPVAISKQLTGVFFNHNDSLTASMAYQDATASVRRMIQRAEIIEPHNPTRLMRVLKNDLANVTKGYAINLGSKGDTKMAFRIGKDLLALQPIRFSSCVLFAGLVGLRLFPFLRSVLQLLLRIRSLTRKRSFQEYIGYINAIS